MPLKHDGEPPTSIPRMHLSDLARACQPIVAKGDGCLTFMEFKAALHVLRIPLSGKADGGRGYSYHIQLVDDDDLEVIVDDHGHAVLIYFGSHCRRNPLASLKAVAESRLALLRRLGEIEHDPDPAEEARIAALTEEAMKG